MKTFIVFAALFAVAFAAGGEVSVVSQTSDIHEDGSYKIGYELSDGSAASEEGVGGVSSHGSFKFTSPEGESFSVTYTADENGFVPQGAHLPVAPEVPEAIVRALEYLRTHPSKE